MSETLIHPSAIVEKGAELAQNVKIGPFCIVGENVKIGANTELKSNVIVRGHTQIGEGNTFYPFCTIGLEPQDLSYKGEPTQTIIGDHNQIREYVSIHRATLKENQVTQLGNNCLIMGYSHLAHDCIVGNNVILVNGCQLAGHVKISDRVIMGGGTKVSQFISIGKGAYIGGGTGIDRDIPNYCTAYGNRVQLKGINIIGLKRMGFSRDDISEAVDFYRSMEASNLSPRAFVNNSSLMGDYLKNVLIQDIANFIDKSEIGLPPFMS